LVKSTNKLLKGKVTEVSTSTKNTGGQYLVKVILDKTDEKLLSGMFTSVQFPIEKKADTNNVILIPKSALVTQGQLTGVYTIGNENTALLRWLRIGKNYGDEVEVLSGLSADEQYIVSSDSKLFNGAKVTIQ
jgi:multidrug efflux pump subunit AcrA (membrane-fusion protein)